MTDTAEPQFLIHQASHLFLSDPIFFQVIQMNKSVLVWIGKSEGKLGDMSIAVPPLGSQTSASATTVIGKNVSEQSRNLARRLATKYHQQFYVTLDLNSSDDLIFVFVEKKLKEMLTTIMA